ncbi:MAG TPA: hypothetical protein VGX95_12325 [Xanthobacteraceae bacterium]|nr:hypothetical protein [Xanthobacteraceae bacterium]
MAVAPPYVNPLTPEQVDSLKISEIRFTKFAGKVDASIIFRAEELIKLRLTERLGAKFAPGRGNSVLIVTVRDLRIDGPVDRPQKVGIALGGTIVQAGFSASYSVGEMIVGRVQTATGEINATERLPMSAEAAADGIVNLILTK